jgi:hypothetical protein
LLIAVTIIALVYVAPASFPALLVWEEQVAGMVPVDYQVLKATVSALLLAFILLRQRYERKKNRRIFCTKRRGDLHLEVPDPHDKKGSLTVALVTGLLFFSILSIGVKYALVAPRMVSITATNVNNMQRGPSLRPTVIWQLDKNFPLQVLYAKGMWYKKQDYKEASGWTRELVRR